MLIKNVKDPGVKDYENWRDSAYGFRVITKNQSMDWFL